MDTLPGVPPAQAGPDGKAAARAAEAYMHADAKGRGARTCKLIIAALRAQLAQQSGGCAEALTHPAISVAGQTVGKVKVTGTTAAVAVAVPGKLPRSILLQKEKGHWRVADGGT
jgi:hypothetical protein